ncbi:Tfp pilus assembly protein FimT [Serratia entomophila]|nr:Tfp pilus assembly protein FimT [Serratia entomophila]CAI1561705.1 Tfp pilus assembly protein FimT [Serratia entomophila]CAI1648386.1 Tfp pilus assembly protein FimT [Serratia entomophila]CAI1705594.1 Tfp pilus assembly protein FimT [Serratia entomophila]CAI1789800.1 Tfp pilus assembly protein FimT [Serratia entomophila]
MRSALQPWRSALYPCLVAITLAAMNANSDFFFDARQRGMTLIELLAVILIAGMLTGWGVSHWRHYQQALRLEHTAQQLLAFLVRLQADANWRNRPALLWFKAGEPWCIGSGEPPPDCVSAPGELYLPHYRDVLLSAHTGKDFGFYGLRNSAQGGHIVLSNGAGSLRLVLSARGRLRLCSERLNVRGIALCQL